MIETLVVVGIVLLSAGGVGYGLYRAVTGQRGCAGCQGCGSAGKRWSFRPSRVIINAATKQHGRNKRDT